MASGIYIYANQNDGKIEPYTAGLVTAARSLNLEETITVFTIGDESLKEELAWDDLSTVIIKNQGTNIFQEDIRSEAIARFLREREPYIVIIPAEMTAKSLFSRVAAILDIGLTADCTRLYMEDNIFKQEKPAFGNDAMVVTKESKVPAMVSLVTGIYQEEPRGRAKDVSVETIDMGTSGIELVEIVEQQTDSIINAEHILSLGKGAIEGDGFELAKSLAQKMGAAVGGTRPLVDNGFIDFEQQIGQTGYTVHPKTCLFFGVSGAIQHTEGVRDTEVTIAINNDPNAAIFSFADYGVVADADEMMRALMKKIDEEI